VVMQHLEEWRKGRKAPAAAPAPAE
jgi:hypothetical protein